ncbi:hypothetical protein DL96DRAFT_1599298 [Flagelloscypha sp. PMI_526]|nr:hypothetical protein DL96DRAFT_1599298 [Flagelloscypha sp. PMI_526]
MPSSPSPNPDLEMHVVSSQPQTSSTMKISQDAQKSEQEALRLRGGCIPCPNGSVCWIIPIPCCC